MQNKLLSSVYSYITFGLRYIDLVYRMTTANKKQYTKKEHKRIKKHR